MTLNCTMTHALEGVWKEPVVACFKVLCRHSPGEAEHKHVKSMMIVSVPVCILTGEIQNENESK
jgi:hypothetical protein